jgi:hypothetical protein
MFQKSSGFASSLAIASTVMAMVLSTSAMAQSPATGLGQSWPNATDVSVSPHYHVYVFVRDGVRYIQVNDLNGNVLGAVAEAGNDVLVLPIGADAPYVTASHANLQKTAVTSSNAAETVYSDSATQVSAAPKSSGVIVLGIVTPDVCEGANPVDCSQQGAP